MPIVKLSEKMSVLICGIFELIIVGEMKRNVQQLTKVAQTFMINIFLMNSDYYYSEVNITNLIVDPY